MLKAAKGLIKILKFRAPTALGRSPCQTRQRGVSLIEILVVLAIIGALVAVTAPSLDRYLDALTFNTKTQSIARDIARLRIKALVERRMLFFPQADESGAAAYDGLSDPLPEGWSIEGDPVIFFESGACSGGALSISAPDARTAKLNFSAPHCRFDIELS